MKAVVVSAPGDVGALEYRTVKDPVPGPGQIRIRTQAIAVGGADVLFRKGLYPYLPFPASPGSELGGIIDAVGEGVSGLKAGDRVVAHAPQAYADLVVADASKAVCVPNELALDMAVIAAFTYGNAYQILHGPKRAVSGSNVLVHGAGGGVGGALAELAACEGATVTGIVSTAEKAELAASRGISKTYLSEAAGYWDDLKSDHKQGFDLIYDGVGGDAFDANFDLLSTFGEVILYGVAAGVPAGVAEAMLRNFVKSPSLITFSVRSVQVEQPNASRETSQKMLRLLAEGRIRPTISAKMPLAHASEAHAMLERRTSVGKIVLTNDSHG